MCSPGSSASWPRPTRCACRCGATSSGARIVDAGIAAPGSVAAGLLVGEICLGGFGSVALEDRRVGRLAELAGGGELAAGAGLPGEPVRRLEPGGKQGRRPAAKFFSLGSGPARALAAKERLYAELGWRDRAERGVIVLEVDRAPPPVVVQKILRDCGLPPEA